MIRESNQGSNQVVVSTNGLLSGDEDVDFWADAKNGHIRLGLGHLVGENLIMDWQDPSPHSATYVGLMTGWGSTGLWTVCVPGSTATTSVTSTCEGSECASVTFRYLRRTHLIDHQWITLKDTPPLVLDRKNWAEGPRTALAVGRRPKTSSCGQQGPRV